MSSEPQACLMAANAASISASLVTSSGRMSFEPSDSASGCDALLELLVDVGERELGAFAMHGLRDAPGDGTIGRNADDERALSAQEPHVYLPLAESTRPAFCQPRTGEGSEISGRRTLTVSFWPGRSVDCLLMPFQLTRSDTVTPNTCAMRDSVSPLRTL